MSALTCYFSQVSRHLFKWTKEMSYADYYERALTNGVLSIQRGREPGVMIYMLPLGHGRSKARSYHGWGTKFNSFWCCYGTGLTKYLNIFFSEKGQFFLFSLSFLINYTCKCCALSCKLMLVGMIYSLFIFLFFVFNYITLFFPPTI